jgi:hypothetical protein
MRNGRISITRLLALAGLTAISLVMLSASLS